MHTFRSKYYLFQHTPAIVTGWYITALSVL
jgi:hypothetical protein